MDMPPQDFRQYVFSVSKTDLIMNFLPMYVFFLEIR